MYEKKNFVFTIVTSILLALLVGTNIYYPRRLNESGRLTDQLTERIIDAENTKRGLAETIERSQSICEELEQSVDRNITTARAAVEVIEEVRVQVQCLEMELGGFDWDSYYSGLDAYCGLE